MAGHRTDVYDDDAVVDAIVRGESYAQVARAQGVTRACVSQIARGRRRRDLHDRIVEAQEAALMQARRLAVACAVQAMAVHIREGIEGTGETARRCREYLLNRVLGAPGKPAPPVPSAREPELGKALSALMEDLLGPTSSTPMPDLDDRTEPQRRDRPDQADETLRPDGQDESAAPADEVEATADRDRSRRTGTGAPGRPPRPARSRGRTAPPDRPTPRRSKTSTPTSQTGTEPGG
ncbi:MAG: hypothetical protein ACYS5V_15105 [Planctomycetota bacterium]|jgi:hypothetical protein